MYINGRSKQMEICDNISPSKYAPVAQLDRVSASEAEGRAFESRRVRHFSDFTCYFLA